MGYGFSVERRRLWPRRRLAHHFDCPDPVPGSSPRADRSSTQRAGSFAQLIEPSLGMRSVSSWNEWLAWPPVGRMEQGVTAAWGKKTLPHGRGSARGFGGLPKKSHRSASFRIAFVISFIIAFIAGLAAPRLFASG